MLEVKECEESSWKRNIVDKKAQKQRKTLLQIEFSKHATAIWKRLI